MRGLLVKILVIFISLSLCGCNNAKNSKDFELHSVRMAVYTNGTDKAVMFNLKNNNLTVINGQLDETKTLEDDDYLKKVSNIDEIVLSDLQMNSITELALKVNELDNYSTSRSMEDGIMVNLLLNQKRFDFFLGHYNQQLDDLVFEIIEISNVKLDLSGWGFYATKKK